MSRTSCLDNQQTEKEEEVFKMGSTLTAEGVKGQFFQKLFAEISN